MTDKNEVPALSPLMQAWQRRAYRPRPRWTLGRVVDATATFVMLCLIALAGGAAILFLTGLVVLFFTGVPS